MIKIGFSGIVASVAAAAALTLAGPATADIGHNQWVHNMAATAPTTHVNTSAHR